jgi:hypothetical protein
MDGMEKDKNKPTNQGSHDFTTSAKRLKTKNELRYLKG